MLEGSDSIHINTQKECVREIVCIYMYINIYVYVGHYTRLHSLDVDHQFDIFYLTKESYEMFPLWNGIPSP